MAGLRKAKEYDWKDSNLALFGSDTEKNVKKESAQTEKAWANAGEKLGLQIWRIVKFKVVPWPKEDYGKFYDGDSYIVLNTYKEESGDEILYDVHFWIGKHSTQDEYGTAAYKTVELDTFLDDKPVQHREVQGHESDLFRSYFKTIELLSGGAESGFRHVTPETYEPRLLHIHGDRRGVEVKEVQRKLGVLDSSDVFILDMGNVIYLWNGKSANKNEKWKAMEYIVGLKNERCGKPKSFVVEEGQDTEEFESNLEEGAVEEENEFKAQDTEKELYRLSDASGELKFNLEKKGSMGTEDLDPKDVFILDTKKELFVWIGNATTLSEKKNAMTYAHNYLQKTDHPLLPVSCLNEGRVTSNTFKAFNTAIAA